VSLAKGKERGVDTKYDHLFHDPHLQLLWCWSDFSSNFPVEAYFYDCLTQPRCLVDYLTFKYAKISPCQCSPYFCSIAQRMLTPQKHLQFAKHYMVCCQNANWIPLEIIVTSFFSYFSIYLLNQSSRIWSME
jgi:hypothetical protein